MRTLRLPALLAGALICYALPSMAGTTLHAIVEQAWQRSVAVTTLAARQEEAAAAHDVAQSWLAGAPVLGLSDRSDRWLDNRRLREAEVSIAAAVLLPGQASARQQLAARAGEDVEAQRHRARLEVAGQVRLRLWEAAAAHEMLAEKEGHLHHLEDLHEDVQRRVKAGDLARSDGLLTGQEVLAAQAEVAQARTRARDALHRFELLTGVPELPAPEPEPLQPVPPDAMSQHAHLRAAETAEQRARANVALAAAGVQAPPTVTLAMRRERDSVTPESTRSIGIAVHVPLGGKLRNRPAETLAATQLATASAELREAQAALALDFTAARQQLVDVEEALQAATVRAGLLREHTALFEQAFKLGERSLAELLRSQTLRHEAEVAVRQQRVALGLAHARLNQAQGILP